MQPNSQNVHVTIQFCTLGVLITFASLVRLGIGRPKDAIPLENALAMGPYLWSFLLLYVVGISFIKLSVAFFLLRIIHRSYSCRFLYTMMGKSVRHCH